MATTDKKTEETSQHTELALRSPSPFTALGVMRRLFEDLDRMTGLHSQPAAGGLQFAVEKFVPTVEIMRRGDKIAIEVDLPGIAPRDVRISVDRGSLLIEGERKSEHETKEGDVWSCERSYGHFQRVIHLPENADPDSAEARFENGVLEIMIKAPEQKAQRKEIEIKTGESKQAGTH